MPSSSPATTSEARPHANPDSTYSSPHCCFSSILPACAPALAYVCQHADTRGTRPSQPLDGIADACEPSALLSNVPAQRHRTAAHRRQLDVDFGEEWAIEWLEVASGRRVVKLEVGQGLRAAPADRARPAGGAPCCTSPRTVPAAAAKRRAAITRRASQPRALQASRRFPSTPRLLKRRRAARRIFSRTGTSHVSPIPAARPQIWSWDMWRPDELLGRAFIEVNALAFEPQEVRPRAAHRPPGCRCRCRRCCCCHGCRCRRCRCWRRCRRNRHAASPRTSRLGPAFAPAGLA
jgi:hypothetical protein